MGIPCKQLHSYDYGGPYAAFTGAANFYKEIDRMVNTKVWQLVSPPWKRDPQIPARLVFQTKADRAVADEGTKTWKAPARAEAEV